MIQRKRICGPAVVLGAMAFFAICVVPAVAQRPPAPTFTNSIGMQFVLINSGTFTMGVGTTPLPTAITGGKAHLVNGDFDEKPNHSVTISQTFYLGTYEVTNAQYELYDPSHAALRGKLGFSSADNEAVIFVSWYEAKAYCDWLAAKESLPYRLPTEAEWEYSCRAGTTTHYYPGDTLPSAYEKNQIESWYPDPERVTNFPADYASELVALTVGTTPANPWGLYDMHGNVEEWCADWYGPYTSGAQTDPVGYATGRYRVTRGGSHGTLVYHLRSGNRIGNVPEDKNWVIGFRVALGTAPTTEPLPAPGPELYQQNVNQTIPANLADGPDPYKPYFAGPRKYVKIPGGSVGPLFSQHNHDPALIKCPNGDLLAIWYTTVGERSRELALAASRLRYGETEWEDASPFWDVPDRNDHAPAAWTEGNTIYQFVGLSTAATWGNLAVLLRKSTDNGVTWTDADIIIPEHGTRHQPVESVFRAADGAILLPCDATSRDYGGTAIHLSYDNGATWTDTGAEPAGIHAGVAQLANGNLCALGRGDNISGQMPRSFSSKHGRELDLRGQRVPARGERSAPRAPAPQGRAPFHGRLRHGYDPQGRLGQHQERVLWPLCRGFLRRRGHLARPATRGQP